MSSWSRRDIIDQTGRQVVVTGANAGLGLEIATRLAEAGATVTLACRNAEKAAAAMAGIRAAVPSADVTAASLDLADLSSVKTFAESYVAGHDRLDLLINNAGLMAVDQSTTADGFETQFGVNHLGHFALTQRLIPLLRSTNGSRVASMSSMGHRPGRMNFDDLMGENGYNRWRAYFQSKLANLLFTSALQQRLAASGAGTIAVAAHPGGTHTDLGMEGSGWTNRIVRIAVPLTTQPVAAGALPMLRAVTAPDVAGGEYYGPRFHAVGSPKRETPSRRARDAAAADRLWAVSASLTGVDAFAGVGSHA